MLFRDLKLCRRLSTGRVREKSQRITGIFVRRPAIIMKNNGVLLHVLPERSRL